jgi:predicted  nucleic acid-binding Zn-ribbon protein
MKDFRNENKKSKLIFDPKITRKLLKMNDEIKFCPYCGKALAENCECHKNIIVDVKPMRGAENSTIAVFQNNDAFQADLTQIMDEIKAKKEAEQEVEQLAIDLD